MSNEGKAKRGASGQAKAKEEPFRLNGWPPDWQARRRGTNAVPAAASGGSTTVRGLMGGILAAQLGFPMPNLSKIEMMLAHAGGRVTHPVLTI